MQINFFAKNISCDSPLWRRLSVMCQARKMIKFHRRSFRNIKVKQIGQILFCNNPIFFFFFIIPKVCWTVCVFHFLNLESLRRIYVSLFTFRDFRHRRAMMLTTLKHSKTAERNPTTCECIFHQVAVKNVNVSVVKTIYCQCNSIFLRQKKIIVFIYLTGQNRGLSGLKNIRPVIMTGDLLSVIFSPEVIVTFTENMTSRTCVNLHHIETVCRRPWVLWEIKGETWGKGHPRNCWPFDRNSELVWIWYGRHCVWERGTGVDSS